MFSRRSWIQAIFFLSSLTLLSSVFIFAVIVIFAVPMSSRFIHSIHILGHWVSLAGPRFSIGFFCHSFDFFNFAVDVRPARHNTARLVCIIPWLFVNLTLERQMTLRRNWKGAADRESRIWHRGKASTQRLFRSTCADRPGIFPPSPAWHRPWSHLAEAFHSMRSPAHMNWQTLF